MILLETKNKIYTLKFGLKGLILLSKNTKKMVDKKFVLFCGLISQHPEITLEEITDILNQCDLSSLEVPPILSLNKIQELYTKAVGEVGITPGDFYIMTPEEIDWAYEGYLRKKETEANLTKMALLDLENEGLIRLTEDKNYIIGDLAEREQALMLCYKEGNNDEL